MPDQRPLRITWKLATSWCRPARGLHLDGLLAWALVQEALHAGRVFETFEEIICTLPLEKHTVGADWCWKASLIMPTGLRGVEMRYMTAKTNLADFAEKMTDGSILGKPLTTIDTVRGAYKLDAFWYSTEHADGCEAWCVGDPERITALLDHVHHLGKRGRLDHGRIELWSVDEDAAAAEKWRLRAMPEPEDGFIPAVGRLQPPYWKGEGTRPIWMPIPD